MTSTSHPARTLFDAQLAAITARDLDALMDQYHPDAVLVRLDRVVAGTDALRDFFAGYLAAKPEVEALHGVRVTDDTVLYGATMRVGDAVLDAHGTFVLREGKIWRQTAVAAPARP